MPGSRIQDPGAATAMQLHVQPSRMPGGRIQAGPCRQLEHKRFYFHFHSYFVVLFCLFTYISEWHYNANNGPRDWAAPAMHSAFLLSSKRSESERIPYFSYFFPPLFFLLYPRRIFCAGQYAWWDAMTGLQDNNRRTKGRGHRTRSDPKRITSRRMERSNLHCAIAQGQEAG